MGFFTFCISCILGIVAVFATQIPEIGIIVSVSIVGGLIVSAINNISKTKHRIVKVHLGAVEVLSYVPLLVWGIKWTFFKTTLSS